MHLKLRLLRGVSLGFGSLVVGIAAAAVPALPAEPRPLVLEVSALEPDDAFGCRVPVAVRFTHDEELRQLRVIARAFSGGAEVTSTGFSTNDQALIRTPGADGHVYEAVPLQFELTPAACLEIDGLGVAFASCVIGDRPAENCLDKIKFAGSDPEEPLFLSLK